MGSPERARPSSFIADMDHALIGIPLLEDGREVIRYFTDEAAADAELAADVEEALSLAGVWSDLDWPTAEAALDRIRHESEPSPPIEL